MLTLADVVEGVSGQRVESLARYAVRNVVIDSRQALRDDLFVALPGEHTDGHDYVSHALGRGALAALVHHDHLSRLEGVTPAGWTRAHPSKHR